MKFQRVHTTTSPGARRVNALLIGVLTGLATIVLAQMVGEGQVQRDPGFRYPPSITRVPDANAQSDINTQQTQQQSFEAANAERKKQIADDTEKLLKLATDLKAEVDKTNKDTLSLGVIRKADEIEKLAHIVKEKMKLTVGGS
jgi:hypothetical protein